MNERVPVFVVNLERSFDRRARSKQMLTRLGINHEFFSAVDGSIFTDAQITAFQDNSAVIQQARGFPLTKGEIGCSLSHLGIYKTIVDRNIDAACILEDDIDITDISAFNTFTDIDYCRNDTRWDLLLLGHIQQVEKPGIAMLSFRSYRAGKNASYAVPVQHCYSTTGYLIKRNAAKTLLEKGYPVRVPADFLTGDSAKYGIKLRAAWPKIVVPNSEYFESDKSLIADRRIKKASGQKQKSSLQGILYIALILLRKAGFLRKKSYYNF